MPNSFSGDDIQLWGADPAHPGSFGAIPGELRSRLEINRSLQRNPAITSGSWQSMQPATGSVAIALDVEGRSMQALGEAWLQQRGIDGQPHALRLRIGTVNWLEGNFIITRYSIDAPQGEESHFQFSAVSHGQPTITPIAP